jgi:hypothetical protein
MRTVIVADADISISQQDLSRVAKTVVFLEEGAKE